jgi:DNA polymerase-3 subunit beta
MKFQVSTSELLKKLQVCYGVIVPNPVLPITEDFLFKLYSGRLDISATNMETSISTSLTVNQLEEGEIAVPARILIETLKALPDQPLTFNADSETSNIELVSSYGKYSLAGDKTEDFPIMPDQDNVQEFEITASRFASAISKCIFATSNDELRMAMTGVLMQLDFNKVIFVATDAHKLVKYAIGGLNTEISDSIIIPKKTLNLLKNIILEEGPLKVAFNTKNVFLDFGDTLVISRLIDAKYPDYNAVIPVDNNNELIINRKDLQNSLKRIGIYANKSTNQVVLNFSNNSLTISGKDLDFSNEATEQLVCKYNGEAMSIGYNSKIFAELLNHNDTNEIILQLSTPNRAGIIVPDEQEENEHLMMLIMPILSSY